MNQNNTSCSSSKVLTGFLLLLEKSAPVALTNQNCGSRHKRFGKVLWRQLSRKLIRWGLLWRSSEIRLLPPAPTLHCRIHIFNVSKCKSTFFIIPPIDYQSLSSPNTSPHHVLCFDCFTMRYNHENGACAFALSMTHRARHSFKLLLFTLSQSHNSNLTIFTTCF